MLWPLTPVAVAVLLRIGLWKDVRQNVSVLTSLAADCLRVVIVYEAVFRIADRALPAAIAASIVAISLEPVLAPRALVRRSTTTVAHALALLALLRALDPLAQSTFPDAVSLVGFVSLQCSYALDARTIASFVLCGAVLSLASHDARFVLFASGAVPVALLVAQGKHRWFDTVLLRNPIVARCTVIRAPTGSALSRPVSVLLLATCTAHIADSLGSDGDLVCRDHRGLVASGLPPRPFGGHGGPVSLGSSLEHAWMHSWSDGNL